MSAGPVYDSCLQFIDACPLVLCMIRVFSTKRSDWLGRTCRMSRIFPNFHHEPHKLSFLVLDCVVANCENNKHAQSVTKNVT